MGKSARVLGWEFGKSAREMNLLLKEYGYLDGNPGAFGLTEKGKKYAEEEYHSRGTGGYDFYNRNWETRTWNEETSSALAADLERHESAFESEDSSLGLRDMSLDDDDAKFALESDGEDHTDVKRKALVILGVIVAVVVAVILVGPHLKRYWTNTVKPTAKRMRQRLSKYASLDTTDS